MCDGRIVAQHIPAINEKPTDFETSVSGILKIAYEYYIPWSNIDGEFSQVRENWVKKALDSFCNIGLAQQIPNNLERFKILRGRQIQKDILDYVIEKFCSGVSQAFKKPVLEQEDAAPQKLLTGFFPAEKYKE